MSDELDPLEPDDDTEVDDEEDFIDVDGDEEPEEILHGDIIEHPDGSVEVLAPVHTKQELTSAEKQRMAMNLKLMGASYAAIAKQLGYASASGAHKAVRKGMRNALQDSATDLRDATYMQLQSMLMVWWPQAIKGDAQASAVVLQILDRVTRLYGLDGLPTGEEIDEKGVLTIGGTKDNYIEAMRNARGERKARQEEQQ